jgi:hypothetical protein
MRTFFEEILKTQGYVMKTSLKELIRRNAALHSGSARPGRVTQFIPNGKGGYIRRFIDSEVFRLAQAADHAAGVAAAREKLGRNPT